MDRVIDKDTVTRLMNVYEHVDDVDLFTGKISDSESGYEYVDDVDQTDSDTVTKYKVTLSQDR